MNIAAFFDIDGTLYRDSLLVEHFKKLVKYEVLDPSLWHNNIKGAFENWQKRRGNYDDYLMELVEIYRESLKGLDKAKMEFVTDQVIRLKGDKVYMFTRHQIEWHLSQGHKVFFISGSPDYLVNKMAHRYGITDCVGTEYAVDDNNLYTGEVKRMWDAESKLKALGRFVGEYDIDLSASYAYGDTNGDVTMFEQVGHPVAINPTRELLTHLRCDEKLCKIVDVVVERKDVIYKVDTSVEFNSPQFCE